jgi:hypothetical protein
LPVSTVTVGALGSIARLVATSEPVSIVSTSRMPESTLLAPPMIQSRDQHRLLKPAPTPLAALPSLLLQAAATPAPNTQFHIILVRCFKLRLPYSQPSKNEPRNCPFELGFSTPMPASSRKTPVLTFKCLANLIPRNQILGSRDPNKRFANAHPIDAYKDGCCHEILYIDRICRLFVLSLIRNDRFRFLTYRLNAICLLE